MKRVLKILVIGVFASSNVKSQVNLDSLKTIMSITTPDSSTVKNMLSYASSLESKNDDVQLLINEWAINKATAIKNMYLLSKAYYASGRVYLERGDFTNAIDFLGKAQEISHTNNFYEIEINSIGAIANIYQGNRQYAKAIEFQQKALEASKKHNYNKGKGIALYSLGILEYAIYPPGKRNYQVVINYLKEGFFVTSSLPENESAITMGSVLARIYSEVQKFDSAILFLKKSSVMIKEKNLNEYYTTYYQNLAINQVKLKKFEDALESLKAGLEYAQQYKKRILEYNYYQSLSDVCDSIGDFKQAYFYKNRYVVLHDSIASTEKFKITAEMESKYQTAIKEKDITALKAEKAIKELEISKQNALLAENKLEAAKKESEIRNLKTNELIRLLEIEKQDAIIAGNELEAAKRQNEIEALNNQKQIDAQQAAQTIALAEKDKAAKQLEINNQRQTRNYLIAGLAVLSILSYFLYRNIVARKKSYAVLQNKNEEIKEQAFELSRQAKLIAKFQSQMNPHFTFNALHNIYGLVATNESDKAIQQIQTLAGLMRTTLTNSTEEEISLQREIDYLKKYIDFEKATTTVPINFSIQIEKELEEAVIPPMMIQPFIENAIKHAALHKVQSPFIKVLVQKENDLMKLIIKDNGKGFSKGEIFNEKLSHSMSIIKSRVELLMHTAHPELHSKLFTVNSNTSGTEISFYLPLNFSY